MANQHVTKRLDGWAVIGEGNSRATKILDTQAKAIIRAHQILENNDGGELMIHRVNGKIRQKDTINHPDSFPPEG